MSDRKKLFNFSGPRTSLLKVSFTKKSTTKPPSPLPVQPSSSSTSSQNAKKKGISTPLPRFVQQNPQEYTQYSFIYTSSSDYDDGSDCDKVPSPTGSPSSSSSSFDASSGNDSVEMYCRNPDYIMFEQFVPPKPGEPLIDEIPGYAFYADRGDKDVNYRGEYVHSVGCQTPASYNTGKYIALEDAVVQKRRQVADTNRVVNNQEERIIKLRERISELNKYIDDHYICRIPNPEKVREIGYLVIDYQFKLLFLLFIFL